MSKTSKHFKTSKHLCTAFARCVFLAVAGLIAAQPFVARVEAANMYWAAAAGGDFDDPGNWATAPGGLPPAGPPGSDDQAFFNVPEASCLVTFSSSPTNVRMCLWDSDVSFNLAGNTYFLSHVSDSHLSYVGMSSGTKPCVATFSNGILKTSSFVVTGVADAPGKLVFTGADMFWQHVDPISSANTIQNIRMGNNAGGEGRVELRNGASAELQKMTLGFSLEATGALFVGGTGTVLTNKDETRVGDKGDGYLCVETGGLWHATAPVYIAKESSSVGTVAVAGANARLNADSTLYVGDKGSGALLLAGGATTDISSLFYVGISAEGTGRVELSGAGTVLASSSLSYIGVNGAGSVRVSDGAEWQVGSAAFRLGFYDSGAGTVTVSGAGACLKSKSMAVGYEGTGALIVTNGGSANFINGTPTIGERAGSHGRLVVSGTGSVLSSDYPPYIGNNGKGQALIDNGAEWTSGHNIYIGQTATGDGALTVSGGAVVSSVRGCYLGGIGDASGGSAALTVRSGGAVNLTERLRVWSSGTVGVADGTITTLELDMKESAILAVTLHAGYTNALIAAQTGASIDGVAFQLSLAEDFSGHDKQVFTVIDAGHSLTGEFSGLADGAEIKVGRRSFILNYDTVNNRVTLTYLCPVGTIITIR